MCGYTRQANVPSQSSCNVFLFRGSAVSNLRRSDGSCGPDMIISQCFCHPFIYCYVFLPFARGCVTTRTVEAADPHTRTSSLYWMELCAASSRRQWDSLLSPRFVQLLGLTLNCTLFIKYKRMKQYICLISL